jgi:creatinine amidohydrolase
MECRIDRLHWKELKRIVPDRTSTVLLPIGILEAHGASALGTDILIPERLAEMAAKKTGALVAPTIPYGVPGSLGGYPGTVGVRADVFSDYVLDVLHGLAATGFRSIFIINGHGGNNEDLKETARAGFQSTGAHGAVIHWWLEAADLTLEVFGGAGGHGGADETAAMLAIDPALVETRPKAVDAAFVVRPSVVTFPAPSSLLTYGEGAAPISYDEEKARDFLSKVAARIEELVEEIESRWGEI